MPKSDFMSLRSAARGTGVSHQTIKNWCLNYGAGELIDGRWRISRERLDRILKAKQILTPVRA